jgi:hypothetical protein
VEPTTDPQRLRAWIAKIGYVYAPKAKKGVYTDGHEREDVQKYLRKVFLPFMFAVISRMHTYEV